MEPRVLCLRLSDHEFLNVGVGGPFSFVEHLVEEPWEAEVALALCPDPQALESAWFALGSDGGEIPRKCLMPLTDAVELVVWACRERKRPDWVRWEPV